MAAGQYYTHTLFHELIFSDFKKLTLHLLLPIFGYKKILRLPTQAFQKEREDSFTYTFYRIFLSY